MKAQLMVADRAYRKQGTILGIVALVAAAMFVQMPQTTRGAEAGGSVKSGKSLEVKLESIAGTNLKRVTLSAKAAERLGIVTGTVGEEQIIRKQMVSGLIVPPLESSPPDRRPPSNGFGGYGPSAPMLPKPANAGFGKVAAVMAPAPAAVAPAASSANGEVWVLVTLSPGELKRLALDKPARLLALDTRNKSHDELLAQPTEIAPVEDMKRSMLSLYYKVPGKDHGLAINNRIRVELQQSGSDEKRKVVPYSAVYYDAKGGAWVYVNTQPLVFERQLITVENVVSNLAVLSDGPPVGTQVATVGAPLLYGAEIFGK